MENIIFLSCTFDRRKSFYNKAYYIKDGNEIRLYSYNSKVIIYNNLTKLFTDCDYYPHSMTTNRHIKEFKRQIEAGYIQ